MGTLIGRLRNWAADALDIPFYSRRNTPPEKYQDDVLDIPIYLQTADYTCGFTAGLMVVKLFQPTASSTGFMRKVTPDVSTGVSTAKLVRALRASKIGVKLSNTLDFQAIVAALADGFPVITTVNHNANSAHWVVIYGVGVHPRRVYVAGNDILGRGIYRWKKFQNIWDEEGFGLICWGK